MSILKTIFWCFYPQAAGSPTDTTPILVHKKPVIPQKTGSGKADSNSSITPFNPAQIVTTLAAVEPKTPIQENKLKDPPSAGSVRTDTEASPGDFYGKGEMNHASPGHGSGNEFILDDSEGEEDSFVKSQHSLYDALANGMGEIYSPQMKK